MPAPTPILQLPYPVPNDSVDVPRDVKALADKLDASLGGGSAGGGILRQAPVLDVGVTGQVRAGRQLTAADFTALGLAQPVGLWNLSDLSNLGSDGRALTNKGAVAFAPGINGLAATAAQFTGSTAQALYVADSGAADPFRIRTGSWGCWFRTAKRAVGGTGPAQRLMGKNITLPTTDWTTYLNNANTVTVLVSDGAVTATVVGISDVCDDRWHCVVATHDGTTLRAYVDGVLEATITAAFNMNPNASAPLNIGAYGADATTAAGEPHFGRVDEAFVTADVLSEDQVRCLYAAKITHTLGVAPTGVRLSVNRRRKGAALAPADFTTTPLRLHNFTGGTLTDEGSNAQPLASPVGGTSDWVAGADGGTRSALTLSGPHAGATATDAGLPAALTARAYGCWFKTTSLAGVNVMAWGAVPGTNDARMHVFTNGTLIAFSGGDSMTSPYVADGQWHHAIAVEDNAAIDGVRRKLYVDGRLAGTSTVMNAITLGGANFFRVGANSTGGGPFTGQIDGAFVTGYALDAAEIARLYAKGSQGLGASPKNAGDHVERMDATAVYLIADTLETQHTIDLGVSS